MQDTIYKCMYGFKICFCSLRKNLNCTKTVWLSLCIMKVLWQFWTLKTVQPLTLYQQTTLFSMSGINRILMVTCVSNVLHLHHSSHLTLGLNLLLSYVKGLLNLVHSGFASIWDYFESRSCLFYSSLVLPVIKHLLCNPVVLSWASSVLDSLHGSPESNNIRNTILCC